jgi:acetylglutamate kinase
LIRLLHAHDYLPVVASIGLEDSPEDLGPRDPVVLNVNADVMACRIAVALGTADLAIAGGTPGVLDDQGQPIVALDMDDIERVISRGTATAGMVAKLSACRVALERGVATIRIIDGRDLDEASDLESVPGTLLKRVSAATAGDRHRTGSTTGAN